MTSPRDADLRRIYARVFLDATDPILIEDLEGVVLDVNREAVRTYGWTREELIGRPIKHLVPSGRHPQAEELLRRCLAGEVVTNVQGLRHTRDGEVRDVLLTLSLLTAEDGQPVAVATFAKDITELRVTQARLEALNRDLEARVAARTAELEAAMARLQQQLEVARAYAGSARREVAAALRGESPAVRVLRDRMAELARTAGPVLLVGPSGAGEEAVARALHAASARADGAFLHVSCTLVATSPSETLFGHRSEGSGKARLARGGTLYLEQLDRLPRRDQEELLRVLRDGDDDIWVLAFSSREPGEAVRAGHLDAALLRRFRGRRLGIPPLAERSDDIAEIAQALLEERARRTGKAAQAFDEDALDELLTHTWPGHVRELRTVVERAVDVSPGGLVSLPKGLLSGGRQLGGYHLREKLGKGGMGEVWRADHDLLRRPAAVKLIQTEQARGDAGATTAALRRFEREAMATARLRSPHTVQLYDFGVAPDGVIYYVMELLEGLDLDELVETYGPLSPARAVELVAQATYSIEEAHAVGMVHRDLKPSNLFLTRLGAQVDVVKVLDFGVVKTLGEDHDATLTAKGVLLGTPAFMAPEVYFEGARSAGPPADIYALGCVLYWLVTGDLVFRGRTPAEVMFNHGTQPPPRPSEASELQLPPGFDEVVVRCLSKSPPDRPGSAAELRRALRALPLDEPWSEAKARAWWDLHRPGS